MKYTRERFKTYKTVFDEFVEKTLYELYSKGIIDELLYEISIGKEANVFLASSKQGYVVLKIYRLETNDFNRMRDYLIADPRFTNTKKNKRSVIFTWAKREFRNLKIAYQNQIPCPKPIFFKNNILVMSLISNEKPNNSLIEPALKLKDAIPKNPKEFYNKIKEIISKLNKIGYVHGDLSEYNILNKNEEPVFIDFSHMTPIDSVMGLELNRRDKENIERFFNKILK